VVSTWQVSDREHQPTPSDHNCRRNRAGPNHNLASAGDRIGAGFGPAPLTDDPVVTRHIERTGTRISTQHQNVCRLVEPQADLAAPVAAGVNLRNTWSIRGLPRVFPRVFANGAALRRGAILPRRSS